MARLSKLLFVIVLTFFATGTQGRRGGQSGLQQFLGSFLKPAPPATFSPTTDCTKWLRNKPESIVYNYGVNDSLSGAGALRDCLLRDEAAQARQKVREILIAFPSFNRPNDEQQPLQDLLQILPNLESIRCSVYSSECASLVHQEHVRDVTWSMDYDYENRERFFIECSSDSLVYHGGQSDEKVNQLYRTLIACPNIRSLSLSLSQGGCVIEDTPRSFSWKTGDRFPCLEYLTLSGYDWDSRVNCREPSNAQSWKAAMDWSKLKGLDIDLPSNSFLETFRGELASLESLVLRHRWGFWGDEYTLCEFDDTAEKLRQNYTSFIATLPPLRELSISGMGRLLNMTPILKTHGDSLEKLSIHEFEYACRSETGNATGTRPVLSVSEVEEISVAAPNLQFLALDVYRTKNKWPASMFKTLSGFTNLFQLTLYFDLEDPSRTRYTDCTFVNEEARDKYCRIHELMEPQLNHTTAGEIFHTIRQYQAGTKLQNITLYAGNFGKQEGGGLRNSFHYDNNKPVKYECWMEGDSIECKGQQDLYYDDDMFP